MSNTEKTPLENSLEKWGIYHPAGTINGIQILTRKGITITALSMLLGTSMLASLFFTFESYIVGGIILLIGLALTTLTVFPSIKYSMKKTQDNDPSKE